jgi:hypothetical protein
VRHLGTWQEKPWNDMKTKYNESVTLLINTCDAYNDVLELFICAFKEYWPDCHYPVVVNTESKVFLDYPASIHAYQNNGATDHWGERLLSTLDSIDTEFVIMLFDDFILESDVDTSALFEAIQLLKSDINIAVVYLINTALPTCNITNDTKFIKIKNKAEYKLNSSPAIWRKSSLSSYTGIYDTPWSWEVFGSYRTFSDGKRFYTLNPVYNDIYHFNKKKGGAIYRGKWVKEVVSDKIEKYGVKINPELRGFSDEDFYEPRSFKWKINFIRLGFQSVGLKAFYFIVHYIREKIKRALNI